MKHYKLLLLAAPLIFGAPVIAEPAAAPAVQLRNDLYKEVQAKLQQKKYMEAMTQAEQILKAANLSASDKTRFLNAAADASMNQEPAQFSQAKRFYEKIVDDPAILNSDKIAALKNLSDAYIQTLAGQYLDQMDLSPAHDALNRALQLPNLKPQERAVALENIGNLYEREDNNAQAIATYEKISGLKVDDKIITHARQLIAGVYAGEGQMDKVITLYHQHHLDFIPLYNRLNDLHLVPLFAQSVDMNKADKEIYKILDNTALPDKVRWAAFTSLRFWDQRSINLNTPLRRQYYTQMQQTCQKYLPSFLEQDPNRAGKLKWYFGQVPVSSSFPRSAAVANPGFIAWAAPLLLKVPRLSDNERVQIEVKYVNALAKLGKFDAALKETDSMIADSRADAPTHFWARLVASALKSEDVADIVKQEKTLSEKDKAQAVLDAAQTMFLAGNNHGNDHMSQTLFKAYQGLYAQPARAYIDCPFIKDAPDDVGSWTTSPLFLNAKSTAKLDRPYGDNLQFLLDTDSAVTGRNAGTESQKTTGDTDTDFHIACDAEGVHFFFDVHDSHAQEVVDGLLRGGSMEMYFAPGENQAYYFLMAGFPGGKVDTGPGNFITMYPNSGFRLPSQNDGTLRASSRLTKDGFGLSLFLSWELFYDKLPSNGTRWQFESIRWTRSGGFSFGGSQSVHNRSSWGDIVFSGLSPQDRIAIKRAIIFKAVANYRDAKKITIPVGRWADPELGDPVFYQVKVAPLLARLDQYAEKVNENMTAAEVETIYDEAVPGWMEIDHKVAALRMKYLKEAELAK